MDGLGLENEMDVTKQNVLLMLTDLRPFQWYAGRNSLKHCFRQSAGCPSPPSTISRSLLQLPSSEGRQKRPKGFVTCSLFLNINIAHQTHARTRFLRSATSLPLGQAGVLCSTELGSQERSRDSVNCPFQPLVIVRLLSPNTFSGGMFRQYDGKPARSEFGYLKYDKSPQPHIAGGARSRCFHPAFKSPFCLCSGRNL